MSKKVMRMVDPYTAYLNVRSAVADTLQISAQPLMGIIIAEVGSVSMAVVWKTRS